jgi:hypothetical protein
MKVSFVRFLFPAFSLAFSHLSAQTVGDAGAGAKHLFIDVHQMEPGKLKYADVVAAHAKDKAVQGKYGVNFIKFWVDESRGVVYCLSSASDTASIRKAHAEAHGLMPERIYEVTDGGPQAAIKNPKDLLLDIHYLGAGKVTAKDAAGVHQKDLAVQKKYHANFINYYIDEKRGVVMCLVEAKDSSALLATHKEAHGLMPSYVMKVKQGQ